MMFKSSQRLCFSLAATLCLVGQGAFATTLNYESYLESWNSSWSTDYQGLPAGPGGAESYAGVVLDIGFACYNFDGGLNGLQFTDGNINTIRDYVHSHGAGKVKVSFGGGKNEAACAPNYFLSQTTYGGGWPGNISALATGVAAAVSTYSLDGVDFDIEDPNWSVPATFAAEVITFLQAVRTALGPSKIISLTIPAQGWSGYQRPLAEGVAAISGLVNYINFMEYDIWAGVPYPVEQIKADIETYTSPVGSSVPANNSPGWGISPSLIQLGLMTGSDDGGKVLSVADAGTLASYAVTKGLYGVMTWDLDRDATDSYQYSVAIRAALAQPVAASTALSGMYPQTIRQLTLRPFVQQAPPPHGAP